MGGSPPSMLKYIMEQCFVVLPLDEVVDMVIA